MSKKTHKVHVTLHDGEAYVVMSYVDLIHLSDVCKTLSEQPNIDDADARGWERTSQILRDWASSTVYVHEEDGWN